MSENGDFDPTKDVIYGNTMSGWDPEEQLMFEGIDRKLPKHERKKRNWQQMEDGFDPDGIDAANEETFQGGRNIAVLFGKKVDKARISDIYQKWFGDEIKPPFNSDENDNDTTK